MDFASAIKSGFKNYVQFRGTAKRSEFWYWVLFTFLVGLIATTIDNVAFATGDPADVMNTNTPISDIANLVFALPTLAVGVRRMRDAGFSAWFLLLQALPIIPLIVMIVTFVSELSATGMVDISGSSEQLAQSLVAIYSGLALASSNPEILNQIIQAFQGTITWLGITALVALAVGIFFLVIYIRPTKTAEQGNRLVAASPQASVETDATA